MIHKNEEYYLIFKNGASFLDKNINIKIAIKKAKKADAESLLRVIRNINEKNRVETVWSRDVI